jgi:hypothetical protein
VEDWRCTCFIGRAGFKSTPDDTPYGPYALVELLSFYSFLGPRTRDKSSVGVRVERVKNHVSFTG